METNHLDKQNFFDLGNLDSLRKEALSGGDASTDASKAALKKAAAQFEAIFTQMLLKSMRKANEAFEDKEIPLQVAVMGCVVNGPGEAKDADLGIAAGNKRGHLFVKGFNVAVVPEDEMVDALVEWAVYIKDNGFESALEKAKSTREEAKLAAEEDRRRNLEDKGEDANSSEQVVELIKKARE